MFLFAIPANSQNSEQKNNEQKPQGGAVKPAEVKPAAKVNPADDKRAFLDVPRDNWAYAAVDDLQHKGLLDGYPDTYFKAKRVLTNYEFGVAVTRVIHQMSVLSLSADGKKLETNFGIPRTLPKEQAQEILKLWKEFSPELEALGAKADRIDLVAHTLDVYINDTKFPAAPGVHSTP